MTRHRTLVLTRKDIEGLVDMGKAIKTIEEAFRQHGLNKTQMPPKIYLHLNTHTGDFRAMPAYIEKPNRCGLKWVNVHPNNNRFGLPTVMAVIILSDPKNGLPLCIMEGAYATGLRTGAAGAVAAKYLARKNSKVVAMLGCGAQARTQLQALRELFPITEVRVWGKEEKGVVGFINDMKGPNIKLVAIDSIRECLRNSDIVVTTTPSRRPLVRLEWLKKGAHINAIGADAKGKQELEPLILKNSKVVVDSWEQASHSGEINVALSKGLISKKDIYAEIGEIVSGAKKGRVDPDELTVFDSTGLAIQDVAVADLIYKTAIKKKTGIWLKLV